jgi:hypothetical protein
MHCCLSAQLRRSSPLGVWKSAGDGHFLRGGARSRPWHQTRFPRELWAAMWFVPHRSGEPSGEPALQSAAIRNRLMHSSLRFAHGVLGLFGVSRYREWSGDRSKRSNMSWKGNRPWGIFCAKAISNVGGPSSTSVALAQIGSGQVEPL